MREKLLEIKDNRVVVKKVNVHFKEHIVIHRNQPVLFGTAYYAEYQPTDHLARDIDLIAEAGMNVIRVGEGSWSHWEPEDGTFSLDWLQPVLDAAHDRGIQAIIGVPTFAIPQWLVRKYPEIALHDENGNARFFGGREEHSLSHPVFTYYSERLIRKIVERYATHPAVIGWQLHNEPGLFLNYSPDIFEGFKDHLRHTYHTVENLNKAWGLVYWSHELSTWDDLWKPEGNAQPQYDIEWRRYQAKLTDDLLDSQRRLISSIAPKRQFITVNMALGRDALDEARSAKHLDIAGSDLYFHMQNGMRLPNPDIPEKLWFAAGPWQIAMQADRTFSLKQKPFYVAETDGGPIGGAADNYPAFHGQLRQAAWQMISRGARMIEYWQWQQLHYGTETYWGSILPHDRQPGRIYAEVAALGRELSKYADVAQDLTPDHDITMLYSVESRWALSYEPYTAQNATNDPHRTRNAGAFDHLMEAFYAGAFLAGRQVSMVHDSQIVNDEDGRFLQDPGAFAQTNPLLVAVGIYTCSDGLLAWMREYIASGGHVVLGPRSTYADSLACARLDVKPSRLSDDAQASYQEFSNLGSAVAAVGSDSLPLREGSKATEWIDCLETHGAQTLATSDDPHFGQFPLITTATSGKGQVTMVGTVPNRELAASLYDYLLPGEQWVHGHETISHSSGTAPDGSTVHFLFNWSWAPTSVQLPMRCTPLDGESPVEEVHLGSWDVAIVKQES